MITKIASLALKNPVASGWVLAIGAALIVAASGYAAYWITDLIASKKTLTLERDAEKLRADMTLKALEVAQASALAAKEALEADAQDQKARSQKLSDRLLKIEASNEKIDCPVPDMLRGALTDSLR